MDCDYGDSTNCWGITEIPGAVKGLKDLVSLRLTVNAIAAIPIELTELDNLKLVDLSDDAGLRDLNNISKCKSLQYLYLYGCGLSKLPDNIGELINLKDLGLTGNNFSKDEQARIKKALPNCKIRF
jgi:Leucine-rich repeat (LRR) protein